MTDTIRTDAALIALLSDGAAAHSTNRQLIRDLLVSLAVTGTVNGVQIDRHGDINVAPSAGSLLGQTLAANVIYSALRYFGASPILSAPQLASPTVTGPLTLDPTTPRIVGDSLGRITLTDIAGTTFFLLRLGGTTSAFPALQRNGAGLTALLADGSGRTTMDALRFTAIGGPIIETAPVIPTYSTSITFAATSGNTFIITATNGTAFTINAPTAPSSGQRISIKIKNASGGALGVITWNAVFKMAAFTNPANGFSRSIRFTYDGTNWVEERNDVDIPN